MTKPRYGKSADEAMRRCGAKSGQFVCDRDAGHTGDHRGYNEQIDEPMFWKVAAPLAVPWSATPFESWHEDDGPVLWWTFPIHEPPYVGTPLDDEWIDRFDQTETRHLGWTRLNVPVALAGTGEPPQPEPLSDEERRIGALVRQSLITHAGEWAKLPRDGRLVSMLRHARWTLVQDAFRDLAIEEFVCLIDQELGPGYALSSGPRAIDLRCEVHAEMSRICERGTAGCTIRHGSDTADPPRPDWQKHHASCVQFSRNKFDGGWLWNPSTPCTCPAVGVDLPQGPTQEVIDLKEVCDFEQAQALMYMEKWEASEAALLALRGAITQQTASGFLKRVMDAQFESCQHDAAPLRGNQLCKECAREAFEVHIADLAVLLGDVHEGQHDDR